MITFIGYPELVDWCKSRSITIRGYQGSGLDGNNSKNFFKASHDLALLLGAETATPITSMLQKFDKVTRAFFNCDLEEYPEYIQDKCVGAHLIFKV